MIYKYANYRYSAGTTCIHANIQPPFPSAPPHLEPQTALCAVYHLENPKKLAHFLDTVF